MEQVSRMRHLTEAMPLSVYNEVFSKQHETTGHVGYYDAASDMYDELPSSSASLVKLPDQPKMQLLQF